jgi:putative endonuclease
MVPCVARKGEAGLFCARLAVATPFHVVAMHYVYLLRSEYHPAQTYVGYTGDLQQRLATHHAGGSLHTAKYRPWRLVTYLGFSEKSKAMAFEKYLESHSGKAFARKCL